MEIQIQDIKILREKTGLGIAECKSALKEAGGNKEKALEILAMKSKIISQEKENRIVKEGVISAYVHSNNKIGVLVELLCETDFVARSVKFQNLAHEIALQIAAANPQWISKNEVPLKIMQEKRKIIEESLEENKPLEIKEKIIQGKLEQFLKENCLLEQSYIRDEKFTINDLIQEHIALFKENIKLSRFIRFSI
ncbi:MAG: Elongation factor Ts [Parcubacteria group bacterium ADurb.Bin159]|nr:MAG: Elongation factor Ts [Parcubacteria group bacterium ADurb.Bin159]